MAQEAETPQPVLSLKDLTHRFEAAATLMMHGENSLTEFIASISQRIASEEASITALRRLGTAACGTLEKGTLYEGTASHASGSCSDQHYVVL